MSSAAPSSGIPTAAALAAAVAPRLGWPIVIVQPAGPHDRYATTVRLGEDGVPTVEAARLVVSGEALPAGEGSLVAVDLPPTASGLTAAMADLGREALAGPGAGPPGGRRTGPGDRPTAMTRPRSCRCT